MPKDMNAITLKEALARHNAKHPESQLHDVTESLEAAGAERLRDLMEVRDPDFGDRLGRTFAGTSPRIRYVAAEMCAAMWAVHRVHGTDWEEMAAVLGLPSYPLPIDPEAKRLVIKRVGRAKRLVIKRVGRAMRLLGLLVKIGCVKRGEGTAARNVGGRV